MAKSGFDTSLGRIRSRQLARVEVSERRWLLRTGDLIVIGLCIMGALLVWSLSAGRTISLELLQDQSTWLILIPLGWVLWLWASGLYEMKLAMDVRQCAQRILLGAGLITFAYMVVFFVTFYRPPNVPPDSLIGSQPTLRIAPALAIGFSTAMLILFRMAFARLWSGARSLRRVLILGAGAAGRAIANELLSARGAGYKLVGFIDDDPRKLNKTINDARVLGTHEKMLELVQERQIDEVVIAISAGVQGSLFQQVMDCHERGVSIVPMPIMYERLTGKIAVEHIGSQWYVALPLEQEGYSIGNAIAHRAIDVVVGGLFFIAFLMLTPFIALAIRLDSKGSIFYRQERMGLHGKVFHVYKFRSMKQDAESRGIAIWASENDPRVTRVGKFLRKSRLDELPQSLNILLGDMSMVGPRPERPQLVAELQKQIPFYRTRLAAKPGLTGWAQVNYGYVGTVEDTLVKLQYDLYYIKHASLLFDLRILAKTVGVVLRLEGR